MHFAASGLAYEPQKLLEVYGSAEGNVLIGHYIPDFIVADTVVVEIEERRAATHG